MDDWLNNPRIKIWNEQERFLLFACVQERAQLKYTEQPCGVVLSYELAHVSMGTHYLCHSGANKQIGDN